MTHQPSTRPQPEARPWSRSGGPHRRLVVGCGALGMRVAKRWLAAGEEVWGTTRTRDAELTAAGIRPVLLDVGSASLPPLPEVDTVLWAVGFERGSPLSPHQLHVAGLERLLAGLSGSPRILFSSSTGVWGDGNGELVDEQTPVCPARPSAAALVEAERLLHAHPLGPGVALRFAGLYGPGRLPRLDDVRAGRPIAANPQSWLNLIHLDDAALVVCLAAAAETVAPCYVVADGQPLQRGEWYRCLATLSQSPAPRFTAPSPAARGGNKRAHAARMFRDLAPPLAYPNALTALTALATALT